ncbi:hypothetical protein, partial [Enterobacter cloacae complex sp. GF14B]|uniref:hypothetical protein n=1 Tax=Enterobacter cloacae complex sp. GF14B TaxID=2511982 RepID=UPI001CA52468
MPVPLNMLQAMHIASDKTHPNITKKTYKWVPKASLATIASAKKQKPCKKRPTRPKKCKETWRWIPKRLLEAQGYYEGNDQIWVPKRKLYSYLSPGPCKPNPVAPKQIENRGKEKIMECYTPDLELVWVPKKERFVPPSSGRGGSHEASSSSCNASIDVKASPQPPPTIVDLHEATKQFTPPSVQESPDDTL